MSDQIVRQFEQMGVFPIIVIDNPEDAAPLGEALLKGGMPCAEVTFRTAGAAAAIESLAKTFPEMLIGAGTVLKPEQAQQAKDCGARFVLSPGFNPTVVDYCRNIELPIFPGVCTPSEIEAAMGKGLTTLKFFPAEAMGGLAFLKAVCAPLSMVRFLPTGGVNTENLKAYLAFDRVLACAGTWIARKEWLRDRRFDLIQNEAAEAVRIAQSVRPGGRHV